MGVSPSTKNIKPYLSNNNKSLLEILKLLDDYYFPTDDRNCYRLNFVLQRDMDTLTPGTWECDLTWK